MGGGELGEGEGEGGGEREGREEYGRERFELVTAMYE